METFVFKNRVEAGRLLAERIAREGIARLQPVLLALPRGGVPVAHEIGRQLGLPTEVLVVRKIGAPGNREFGIGAICEEGVGWLDERTIRAYDLRREEIERIWSEESAEVDRRVALYRNRQPLPDLSGRVCLIIDDGLATGVSAVAAARFARKRDAEEVVLAVPVASASSAKALKERGEFDRIVAVEEVEKLGAIGLWYEDFSQVSDEEVIELLRRSRGGAESSIEIPVERENRKAKKIQGDLAVPERPKGIVIFAHGSGSSRRSPRNRQVARTLNDAGIATLLLDLLTEEEENFRNNVFDIPLLARRLGDAATWVRREPSLQNLPLGLLGASTGAAAALVAAADLGSEVSAVASQGGRPDLAHERLEQVRAPVLLLVGDRDFGVIELNEHSARHLRDCKLVLVPGATHLFEEPGTLEKVADASARFFVERIRDAHKMYRASERRKAAG